MDKKPIISPSPVVRVGREPGKTLGGFTKTVYKPNFKAIQLKSPSASSEPKIDLLKAAQDEEKKRLEREARHAQMNQPRNVKREASSSSTSKPVSLTSYRPYDPKPENNRLDIHEIDDTDDFLRRPVSLPFPYMSADEGKADEAELAAQRLASGLNVKSEPMEDQEDIVKPVAARRKVAPAVPRQTRHDTLLSPFKFEPTSAAHILQNIMEHDEGYAPVFIQLPSHLPYRPPPPEKPAPAKPGAPPGKGSVDLKKEEKKPFTDGSHTDAEEEDEDFQRMTPEEKVKHLAAKEKRNRYDRLYHKNADHSIDRLPAGQMGKLVVYKSGRVELHCGSVRVDVTKGTNPMCYQEVVSLEPTKGEAFQMASLDYRLSCMIQEGGESRTAEEERS